MAEINESDPLLSQDRKEAKKKRKTKIMSKTTPLASDHKVGLERFRGSSTKSWSSRFAPGGKISDDEMHTIMADFAEGDNYSQKTWSRRFVEGIFSKFKWYNPQRDDPQAPQLKEAWAYYEHVTLARKFSGAEVKTFERAEPGEIEETELYSPFRTPEAALNEWGIGIGLYFATLRVMAFIVLCAAALNLVNILYFSSPDYSGEGGHDGLYFTLKGTAICTNVEWVACTECEQSEWDRPASRERFASWTNPNDGSDVTFVKRNLCESPPLLQGLVSLGTFLFMITASFFLTLYQVKREVRLDEDKLTGTDYSIKISNPPPDALDPEEWRVFFEQFAEKQVTVCTIALNNDALLRALMNRRINRDKLRRLLPRDVDLDNEVELFDAIQKHIKERNSKKRTCFGIIFGCTLKPLLQLLNMFLPAETLKKKIDHWTQQAKKLQKKKYKATHVFITFETEEGQRAALTALSIGKMDVWLNNTCAVAPNVLFRGKLLKAEEPTEPSAVRWLDMNVSNFRKIIQRSVTFFLTLGLIALSGFLISRARSDISPMFFGVVVSVLNFIIPNICKLLMLFESHNTEGGRQTSIYVKITLFRWANTAILTRIITPFAATLGDTSNNLIPSINAIMWTEMLVAPMLRLADIIGNLKKHIFAPRARTQEEMNLYFLGTPYNLAERYTDFTKSIFLAYFYSALDPNAFFLCFGTLTMQYLVDKFCLMRIWSPAPFIGTGLAKFSRRYFLSAALVIFGIVSAYVWAHFPYDNICDAENPSNGFSGDYENVKFLNGTVGDLTVSQDDSVIFCDQTLFLRNGLEWPPTFPPLPSMQPDGKRWMGEDQERIVFWFGWTSFVVLIVYLFGTFGGVVIKLCMSLFRGTYEPSGKDQKIDFSSVAEIFGYVPQIKIRGFPFPCLACDIDDIDQQLIGWNDPNSPYDDWNLIFDLPHEGMKRKKRITENTRGKTYVNEHKDYTLENATVTRPTSQILAQGYEILPEPLPIYSIIKHWPPEWTRTTS